ncbi:hypothetical protein G4177_14330 [Corallococcus sp. ZKHCc1 1396]|uniref:CARDB domain-containing protein n=1 Tax=Corallococcus soli TaxID=2710757 RepID=A0ABR9PN41_9BACT|nr:CARDB domain-containing protein [Corallococcus soli]MBE4749341.1 hypothetical protein [Corallococcus soli]
MSRQSPAWRHSCLLIAGTLVFTGCGSGASAPEEVPAHSEARSLVNGPDLVVTRIQAPSALRHGSAFTAKVTVCNTGPAPTANYYHSLRLYLSQGATQQFPSPNTPPPTDQQELGRANVGWLDAGACVIQDVQAHAMPPGPGPDGAYHLGAFIDTELQEAETDETNNGFVSGLMGVGSRPDLVITRLDAPASLMPGQSFTATATVCNQGTTPTNLPSVELYLSTTAALVLPSPGPGAPLPPTQSLVGSATPYGNLEPGQCTVAAVSGQALRPQAALPDEPLYLGAAINPTLSTQELRQDNNLFVSGLVGVGLRPDLVVRSVTAPETLRPGGHFTPLVEVCNVGTSEAAPTQVAVFLSTVPSLTMPAGTPSATQRQAGTQSVPALAGGRCATVRVAASVHEPQAATQNQPLYVGAVVDPSQQQQELREDNNTRVEGLRGVGSGPDLVVASLQAPASLVSGQTFTAQARVCNVGTMPSAASQVRLFLATTPTLGAPSSTPPSTQRPLGAEPVPPLSPGECFTRGLSTSADLPLDASAPGTPVYLGAYADPQGSTLELREDNNARVAGRVGMGQGPDLIVTNVTGPASTQQGGPISLSARVCNVGTGSSYPTRVQFALSTTDTVIPTPGPAPLPTQSWIGEVPVSELSAGQCLTLSAQANAVTPSSAQPGQTLYLGAFVDMPSSVQELREDNNTFVSGLLGVGSGPDLIVTALSGPSNLASAAQNSLSATVCNVGSSTAFNGNLELVITAESELPAPSSSPNDLNPFTTVPFGATPVETLLAGECRSVSAQGSANAPNVTSEFPGTPLRLAARVKSLGSPAELRVDNNVFIGAPVGVGNGVDLVVRDLVAPFLARQGSAFSAQVTVCNEGTAPSNGPAQLQLILSTEPTPLAPTHVIPNPTTQLQHSVGQLQVPALGVGQCLTTPVPAVASRPSGASQDQLLYLSASFMTGAPGAELRTDNNSLTGNVFVLLPY